MPNLLLFELSALLFPDKLDGRLATCSDLISHALLGLSLPSQLASYDKPGNFLAYLLVFDLCPWVVARSLPSGLGLFFHLPRADLGSERALQIWVRLVVLELTDAPL